jgi:hypothetical protein
MSLEGLVDALRASHRGNLKSRLTRLDQQKLVLLHPKTQRYYITEKGNVYVEERELAQPL